MSFICTAKTELSTCRPSAIVNNKDPVDQHLHLNLYTLLILICRLVLVDLSTCRPTDVDNKEDPSP